jgi:hypothetical protein
MGRPYCLEVAIYSFIHRGYYQIQRYTQAGVGDYSLTHFEQTVAGSFKERLKEINRATGYFPQKSYSQSSTGRSKIFPQPECFELL